MPAKLLIIILLILALPLTSYAKSRLHSESYYQDKFCDDKWGLSEVILHNMTRVDCITFEYAIEVDFANKWYEAIGQSLYYAMETDMLPGIALIIESKRDCVYWKRTFKTISEFELPIALYTIGGRC